ncbi:MAG TPA: hypothetical protein VHV31_11105 [Nitrolancea sp.]|jgi:hypothetical protein|nr:hypothetical protein [Nitrolancea sp.]
MFGRIPLTTLKLDDQAVSFNRAMLWVDSDERWRLEISPTDPRHLSAIRPENFGTLRKASMITSSGKEFEGHVRVNHRRLYPFRGVPLLLEGVQTLEGFDLDAIEWHD